MYFSHLPPVHPVEHLVQFTVLEHLGPQVLESKPQVFGKVVKLLYAPQVKMEGEQQDGIDTRASAIITRRLKRNGRGREGGMDGGWVSE